MGLTYYPHFKKDYNNRFQVNLSGIDLLGALHGACGVRMAKGTFENDPEQFDWNWINPCVPFRAKAAVAREMASGLKTHKDVWPLVYAKWSKRLFDGTLEEFIKWCDSWVSFLENCSGYSSL